MNQLKGGVFLNYASVLLTNLLGLVITPLMIHKMGTSEYGLYTLIGAFVGYLTLLDLGLNHSVVRFVAMYKAKQDKRSEEQFLGTVLLIYCFIAALVIGVGLWGYFNLDYIFERSLTADELYKARIMYAILLVNIGFTIPGGVFEGVAFGYERFIFPKAARVIKYLVRALAIVLLLEVGFKAIGVVVLDTVLNLIMVIANAIFVVRKLGVRLRIGMARFEKSYLRHIFSFSIWVFLFGLIYQFRWKSGQVILGIQTDTFVVTIFAIGIMLGSYYGTFSSAITNVFLPKATKMSALDASGEELTNMMIKIGRICLAVLLLILIGFSCFGEQFIQLWVGGELGDPGSHLAWSIALVMMIAYTVPLVQGFAHSVLLAKSKLAFKAIVYMIALFISLGFGAWLSLDHGAMGMTWALAIGWFVSQLVINIYYHKDIGLNIPRFYKELAKGLVPTGLILFGLGLLLDRIPGTGWINFLGKIALFTSVYGVVIFKFALNDWERETVYKTLPFAGRFVKNPKDVQDN